MKRKMLFAVCSIAAALAVSFGTLFSAEPKKAKNVILMIGDGMGFTSDIAGTYYRFGKPQAQSYHKFRLLGSATFSIMSNDFDEDKDTGYDPDFFWKNLPNGTQGLNEMVQTTDSAASGTALNWGHKTADGRIGMNINNRPVSLFADEVAEEGKTIGVVTTTMLSNATPAAVMAHQASRKFNMEISREMILDNTAMEVMFGVGHPEKSKGVQLKEEEFEDHNYHYVGGKFIWNLLKKNEGFAYLTMIDSKEDFTSLAKGVTKENLPTKRLIGVLPDEQTLPPVDAVSEDGSEELLKTYFEEDYEHLAKCFPSLSVLSLGALNVLSRNENGFYLMIEGGDIDSANHENDISHLVLEHTGFSRAIDTVIKWVETNSSWDETLLIITADHETGQLWGPDTYTDANNDGSWDEGDTFNGFKHIVNNGMGKVPGAQYGRGCHTNALVPVWIHGAGADRADHYIRGYDKKAAEFYAEDGYSFKGEYIFNNDIAKIMRDAVGLENDD